MPGVAREVYDVPHVTPWGKKIAFLSLDEIHLRRRAPVVGAVCSIWASSRMPGAEFFQSCACR